MISKKMKLRDLLEVQNGYAFASKKFNTQEGIPLIRIRDIKNGFTTKTNFTGEYDKKYIVRSGDFLIGMDGKFRCYQWKGKDALLNQRVCRLQNFTEELNPRFLHYIINKELKKIEDKTGFITVKHLSSSTIENIQISVPHIKDQEKIVAKLDKICAEIDKDINVKNNKKNQINNLEIALLKSVFNNNWKLVNLGDILKTGAGGTPLKSKKKYYEGGKINWLKSGAVCKKDITSSKTFITQEGLNNSSAKLFPKNTVLVAMYGATAAQAGILRFESSTNQAVCGIYPSNKYIPEFLFYFIASIKNELLKQATGVAQPNLSQIKIRNIKIPAINIDEQKKILEIIDSSINNLKFIIKNIDIQIENFKLLKAAIVKKELQTEAA
jgi:type I restriction enzyme, S subunit